MRSAVSANACWPYSGSCSRTRRSSASRRRASIARRSRRSKTRSPISSRSARSKTKSTGASTRRWSPGTPTTCANSRSKRCARPPARRRRRRKPARGSRARSTAAASIPTRSTRCGRRRWPASSVKRPPSRAAGETRLAVSPARHPLRAAGRRQDDGRAARARTGQETRPHAVRGRRAVRRSERYHVALGLPRNDEPVARQRARSDLSGQPRDLAESGIPEPKLGLVTAHGGVLFIDEIGEMAPALQTKAAQGARGQARRLRVVVLRQSTTQRAGLREEALRRRRPGRFHPDRRDDARTGRDRPGDPLALRRGVLRAAHAGADRAHRRRGREAARRAHDEDVRR